MYARWTSKLEKTFLAELERHGNVLQACEAVGVGRANAYKHRNDDAEFARQWEKAVRTGCEVELQTALGELKQRAFNGCKRQIYYKGKPVRDESGQPVYVTEHVHGLLVFYIKSLAKRLGLDFYHDSLLLEQAGPETAPVPMARIQLRGTDENGCKADY